MARQDPDASYRCLGCGHEWSQAIGASIAARRTDSRGIVISTFDQSAPPPAGCPSCAHPYVKWLNYRERA